MSTLIIVRIQSPLLGWVAIIWLLVVGGALGQGLGQNSGQGSGQPLAGWSSVDLSRPVLPWINDLVFQDTALLRERDPVAVYFQTGSQAWELMRRSSLLQHRKDLRGALSLLLQAQTSFESEQDLEGLAIAYYKIGTLYQLWEAYDRAIESYGQSYQIVMGLSQAPPYQEALVMRYATCTYRMQLLSQSARLYEDYYKLTTEMGKVGGRRHALTRLADICTQLGAIQKAIFYAEELAILELETGVIVNQSRAMHNLGYLYRVYGRYDEAMDYFTRALELARRVQLPPQHQISMMVNLASVYTQQGNTGAALTILEQAMGLARQSHSWQQVVDLLNLTALTYLEAGRGKPGLKAIDEALMLTRKHQYKEGRVRCYRTKSQLLTLLNSHRHASDYLAAYADLKDSVNYEQRLMAQQQRQRSHAVEQVERELRLMLTEAESAELRARRTAQEREEALRASEINLLMRERQVQEYALRNQTLEIDRMRVQQKDLERERKLRTLELTKLDQQSRLDQLNHRDLERQHRITLRMMAKDKRILDADLQAHQARLRAQQDREGLMIIVILLGMAGVTATFVSLSRARTTNMKLRIKQHEAEQQNELLGQMNGVIEQKNRYITDSLKYARQIQASIVSGPEVLHQVLPLSYLINRPKDVVSGDFYYLYRNERYTYLASVDCSGHGVAGALLSMLAHQALSQAIEQHGITDPAQALHTTDELLAEAFKRDANDLQRCIDVGLIILDRQYRQISFAGAVHRLMVFIPGQEPIVIRGDRFSIGGLVPLDEKSYSTHRLAIQPGQSCVLASDGFASQLGGPQGRRFGSHRLRAELIRLVDEAAPAAARKAHLERVIDEWMKEGQERQTDDILVVGFRPDLAV